MATFVALANLRYINALYNNNNNLRCIQQSPAVILKRQKNWILGSDKCRVSYRMNNILHYTQQTQVAKSTRNSI